MIIKLNSKHLNRVSVNSLKSVFDTITSIHGKLTHLYPFSGPSVTPAAWSRNTMPGLFFTLFGIDLKSKYSVSWFIPPNSPRLSSYSSIYKTGSLLASLNLCRRRDRLSSKVSKRKYLKKLYLLFIPYYFQANEAKKWSDIEMFQL